MNLFFILLHKVKVEAYKKYRRGCTKVKCSDIKKKMEEDLSTNFEILSVDCDVCNESYCNDGEPLKPCAYCTHCGFLFLTFLIAKFLSKLI